MKALFKSAKKLLKSNGKAFKVYTVVFVVYPYFVLIIVTVAVAVSVC